jgi:four helix bundle protein
MTNFMDYESWERTVPNEITQGSLWKMQAHRFALFLSEIVWHAVTKLMGEKRTLDVAGQRYRAVGSIEANISEGYSRSSGRDRARFYEYALGSTRESRGWYYKARHVLGEPVFSHRIHLLTDIARLLLTMVPDRRSSGAVLREEIGDYSTTADLSVSLTKAPV